MEEGLYELDICYTDNYVEVYQIEKSRLSSFSKELIDETIPSFEIKGKLFLKEEISSVGFGSWVVQFGHENEEA